MGYLSFDTICQLSSLQKLSLGYNDLSGPITPSLNNCTKLQHLDLAFNYLIGHIPDFSSLTELRVLNLSDNAFTGPLAWTIPPNFRNLTELANLDFSSNNLGGDLTELKYLTKLQSLQLFYNQFSGEVPVEFGDFDHLVELSIYNNMFCGQFPQNLGSKSDFDAIDASTNSFTGPIPPNMCRLGKMTYMALLENQFTGEIPASYTSYMTLKRFRVSNNSPTFSLETTDNR
ncbi:hypothetical protein QJS10_CPA10g00610 [Acorus calamus]|uniref:Uncharacterized protein n=1 Tax=Acorus calamus TaxID=4465 RepID=A0AAV9E176_ACOCL|nr:hypothetical protein QJS10_CPA10g00610 [Acorus calamus]